MENTQSKIRSLDTDLSERFIVAACEDSRVRLFTLKDKTMHLISELVGHTGIVTKALFINQGELIASSDLNGKLLIWKLEGQQFVKKAEVQISDGPVYDIAVRYSQNSFTVFCGCDNGILKTAVFDSTVKATVTEEQVHRYGIITVSCNAHFVATGGLDCTAALIGQDETAHFRHHKKAVNAVALAPTTDKESAILATCSEDGTLAFVFKNGKKTRIQEISIKEPCYSLDWNRTGLVLTVGFGEGGFKSYIQGESGDYEEVTMTKVNE